MLPHDVRDVSRLVTVFVIVRVTVCALVVALCEVSRLKSTHPLGNEVSPRLGMGVAGSEPTPVKNDDQ